MDNICDLKIVLEFGNINGKTMDVKLKTDSNIIDIPCINNSAIIERKILLPTELHLLYSGKNNNTDTIIDSDGKIIADLYVKIVDIFLNSKQINRNYWQKNLILEKNNGEKINTYYAGFNGRTTLPFLKTSFFTQMIFFESSLG